MPAQTHAGTGPIRPGTTGPANEMGCVVLARGPGCQSRHGTPIVAASSALVAGRGNWVVPCLAGSSCARHGTMRAGPGQPTKPES